MSFTNMKRKDYFCIFPTYKEIFDEQEKDVLDKLSKGGVAEKLIIFSTRLSSLLYAEHIREVSVQAVIMREFKEVLCSTEDGRKILKWLSDHSLTSLNINNFTMMQVYRLLLNYRKGACSNLTLSSEELLLYLKLLLIANEMRIPNSKEFHNSIEGIIVNDPLLYEKLFWPILLAEIDQNETINIGFEMFRLKSVIDYVIKQYPNAKKVISEYFNERGFEGYQSYASIFFFIYLDYLTNYTNKIVKSGIIENEQITKLFAPLAANTITVANSYLDLKSHPVYYYSNAYYVINWSYLLSQVYVGTFKTLEERFRSIGLFDLKKEAGGIIESTLFKKVLENSFGKIWQKAEFDNANGEMPDAIFKIGNHLFIVELKDRLMDENTMESFDYNSIKKHFLESFVEVVSVNKGKKRIRKKGVTQLAAYIGNYACGKYKGFPYNPKLKIYPIIIYTDYKYRLNGLNHFLSLEFNRIINENASLSLVKHRIRPITIIGLDCLFDLQIMFQNKRIKLADAIDNYHRHVKLQVKRYSDKGVEKYSQLYPSFERYLPEARHMLISYDEMKAVFKRAFWGVKD